MVSDGFGPFSDGFGPDRPIRIILDRFGSFRTVFGLLSPGFWIALDRFERFRSFSDRFQRLYRPGQVKFDFFLIRIRVVQNGRNASENNPKRSENGPKPSETVRKRSETVRKRSETVRNRPKPSETVRKQSETVRKWSETVRNRWESIWYRRY